jgi:hypothetical protein
MLAKARGAAANVDRYVQNSTLGHPDQFSLDVMGSLKMQTANGALLQRQGLILLNEIPRPSVCMEYILSENL